MQVRTKSLNRCLCGGLSLLVALTPVPVAAQEISALAGAVAQPVARNGPDAVEPASSSPIDGLEVTTAESQAGPTDPAGATQAPPLSEARAAVVAAETDAKRDQGRTKWIFVGVGAGMFVPSMLAVHLIHPDPPAARLAGKTPEYSAFYVETYKNRSHARRVKYAWIGVGILWATVLPVMFAVDWSILK